MRKALAVATVLALMVAFTLPVLADSQDNYDDPKYDTTTTTREHDTTKHDSTTTTIKHDSTTTHKDDTTTTKRETTTTKHDDTTTTKPGETTTTQGSTTTTEGSTTTGPTSSTSTTEPPTVTPFCVDVNTASQAELDQLDGISPVLALLIITNRPYETVSDLADVLSPGVFLLILIANADTGAFASDDCITPTGPPLTILICHLPPGNPENVQVIELPLENWLAGIGHGPGQHGGDFAILNEEDIALCTQTVVTTSTTTSTTTTTTMPGATTTTAPTTTTTGLRVGGVTAVCVSDIPFFAYEITEFPGATIINEIRFENPTGPDVVYTNQPLRGQVLWPGASEVPEDWPGWVLQNGVWVEGDDGFLWASEQVTVIFTINPTATAVVNYPPASAICAGPQNLNPNLPPPGAIVFTPSPEDGILPLTGADFERLGFLAGAGLLLGLLILTTARKGRVDTEY